MLGVVELEAILEEELGLFGGGAQLGMLIGVDGSQNAVGEAPKAVLQLGNTLHNLWRGGLRLDVGVEGDLTFDLFDVFGDGGFAVVHGMDDLRNYAGKWILIGHSWIVPLEK